jgi:hypothetical protein
MIVNITIVVLLLTITGEMAIKEFKNDKTYEGKNSKTEYLMLKEEQGGKHEN